MGIQNISEDVILVELPADNLKIAEELKTVNETISKNCHCNIIIDFTRVEIITSSNISNLLILRNLLEDAGHQLVLCNVATMTKCIFVVASLIKTFVFADDKSAALDAVKKADSSANAHS
jgi:anti-anti-sigma regulatory factor